MNLPALTGTIERRVLVNYRVDPDTVARILPAPFVPTIVDGHAIAGICLIELRVRPRGLPQWLDVRSSNGAHRVAVTMPDGSDAVYVPRRDTSSRLNTFIGGRLFPGTHHLAAVASRDTADRIAIDLASRDGTTRVGVTATVADALPDDSIFDDVEHVSAFFERGAVGYSDTTAGDRYESLELRTTNWSVTPLAVERAESTFFGDHNVFPPGTVQLDNALLMRDIDHTWHPRPPLLPPEVSTASEV